MRKLAFLLFTVLWACVASAGNPKTPVFTSFDYPGAVDTEATAIAPSGEIVGRYYTFDGANYINHGFLLSKGHFYAIDVPSAVWTDVTYINPSGQIVGAYGTPDGATHGFVLRDGKYTTIDFLGAQGTYLGGIGPDGEIVGWEWGQDFVSHGFLLDKRGIFTVVDYPGSPQTLLTEIGSGRMTGDAISADGMKSRGFVVENGNFEELPGCDTTYVSGLNPKGDIVGGCIRGFLDENGYLFQNAKLIDVNYPGSTSTYANGINPQGQIVGRYSTNDGQANHGFLLTWKP